jgi:hypothetical protein
MFTGLTAGTTGRHEVGADTTVHCVHSVHRTDQHSLCGPVVMLRTAHQVSRYLRQELYVQRNDAARSDLCIHFCLSYRQWIMHIYLINSSGQQQNVLHIIAPRMFVSIIRHANRT